MGVGSSKPLERKKGEGEITHTESSSSLRPFSETLFLVGHERRIVRSCIIDESLVATASEDGMIHVWNYNTGERIKSYSMSHQSVDFMVSNWRPPKLNASQPQSVPHRLLAIALEKQVMIINLTSSEEDIYSIAPASIRLAAGSKVSSMAFVQNSILLIANCDTIMSWNFSKNFVSTSKKNHDISSMILLDKSTAVISFGPSIESFDGRLEMEKGRMEFGNRHLPYIPEDIQEDVYGHRNAELIRISGDLFLIVTRSLIELRNKKMELIKQMPHENTKVCPFSMNGNLSSFGPDLPSPFPSPRSSSSLKKNASSDSVLRTKNIPVSRSTPHIENYLYLATINGRRLSVISLNTLEVVVGKDIPQAAPLESLIVVDKFILTATNEEIHLWSTQKLPLSGDVSLKRTIKFQANTKLFNLDGKSFASHAEDCVIVVWRNVLLLKEEYELHRLFHEPQSFDANAALNKPTIPTFAIPNEFNFGED